MGTSPERRNGEKSAVAASKETPDIQKATSDALEGTQRMQRQEGQGHEPLAFFFKRTRYSRILASASFAAAAMRETSSSFGWLCALFQLSISMRA